MAHGETDCVCVNITLLRKYEVETCPLLRLPLLLFFFVCVQEVCVVVAAEQDVNKCLCGAARRRQERDVVTSAVLGFV